eukprot:2848769-Rhodomonas_salina.2
MRQTVNTDPCTLDLTRTPTPAPNTAALQSVCGRTYARSGESMSARPGGGETKAKEERTTAWFKLAAKQRVTTSPDAHATLAH